MTLIIAETETEQVVMGADSVAGTGEEVYTYPHHPKIFERGPYLVGSCGLARIGQILHYLVDWPEPPATDDLLPFLVRELVPEIRRGVTDAGAAEEGRWILGDKTVVLVALHAQIFVVGADLIVLRSDGVSCIGSGRHMAYPTTSALKAVGVEPAAKRIEMTLEAVAKHSPLVGPPWRFLTGAEKRTRARAK